MKKTGMLLALLLAACNSTPPAQQPPANQPDGQDGMTQNELSTSLEVQVSRDSVELVLHVTNSGTQPVVLEFSSTQRYDFQVYSPAGESVWTWSADKSFGMMMGEETMGAGESREYREVWAPGNRTGRFVAVGRVVALNRPIEQRAEFEITKR